MEFQLIFVLLFMPPIVSCDSEALFSALFKLMLKRNYSSRLVVS